MNNIKRTPEPLTARLLSLLPELSRDLEADLHTIEPHFACLGQGLQTVFTESSDLAKEIINSANRTSDKSQGSLRHHIEEIVDASLTVLSGCRETITASLQNITASTNYLRELCAICEIIKKKATFLNVVGLNISVESCRTSEVMAMFENFGKEIKALAGNIDEISATIHDNSQKVRTDQLAVYTDITGSIKTFDELSKSAETAVQHALEEIQTMGDLASLTLEKAGRHSQKISTIVGEIVMSIQFHDIARQQIEHIISALGDISALMDTGTGTPEFADETFENDVSVKKGRAQSIMALQSAQLRHVLGETEDIYEKMQTAFKNIGHEVDQLIKNVAASRSKKTEKSDLEQGFRNFKAKLEKLRQLLGRGNELEKQIKETMDKSSRAVSTLSHHTAQVISINIDLQYKAINAIIMTSKLGEKGATLEVLARSVRDFAGELDTLVKDVLNKINSIMDLAGSSDPGSENLLEPAGDIGASALSLDDGILHISEAYERFRQTSFQAEERAGKLMQFIANTGKDLDFFPEWIDGSKRVLKELENLLKDLAPWKGLGYDPSTGAEDDIAQRYTMERERRIHEQLKTSGENNTEKTGENIQEKHDQAVEFSDSKQEDDLDDNIELF